MRFQILAIVLLNHSIVFSQKLPTASTVISQNKIIIDNFEKTRATQKSDSINHWHRAFYIEQLSRLATNSKSVAFQKIANQNNAKLFDNFPPFLTVESLDLAPYYSAFFENKLKNSSDIAFESDLIAQIDTTLYTSNANWTTVNITFMNMPFWAKLLQKTNDVKYAEKAFQNYMFIKSFEKLYSDQDLLWHKDPAAKLLNTSNQSATNFEAMTNAKMIYSLAQLLAALPKTHGQISEYGDNFAEVVIAMMNLQNAEGFWFENLSNSDSSTVNDYTATALIASAMAWGIKAGRLDKDTFTPIIAKAYSALQKHYSQNGQTINAELEMGSYLALCAELVKP